MFEGLDYWRNLKTISFQMRRKFQSPTHIDVGFFKRFVNLQRVVLVETEINVTLIMMLIDIQTMRELVINNAQVVQTSESKSHY